MGDVIDDILAELDNAASSKEAPEASVSEERLEAEPVTGSGPMTTEDGLSYEDIPFSTLFWKPKNVPDHLCRVYRDLPDVPPALSNYVPPKKEIEIASLCWSQGLKVLTVGPTGAGKTLMFEYLAHKMGRPYLRIEHNVFFSDEKVFGQTHINITDDGKTETNFIEGTLPRSMELPSVVVLDETSRNTGHANILYQRVLDRRELSLSEVKEGQGVKYAQQDWIVAGTDNTKGNGDDMDKYSASNVQDQAFINRWDILLESDYLSQASERDLIKRLSPKMDKAVAEALAKFSRLMHSGFKSGEIQTAFSPRNLSAICALYNSGMTVKEAISINYTNRCTKAELSDIQESIRAVFG